MLLKLKSERLSAPAVVSKHGTNAPTTANQKTNVRADTIFVTVHVAFPDI